ncbi:733_t:CDS:2 [Cetraspora pellucida]|uniref:733_t:CDS:1 n=1 Tax=Cetraspora pellucida TaxID=1433469 RepID=A0A9N9HQP1_9GLOM|nr:733_t:CDS:2 [Cetraspora pellucida]
MDIRMEDIRVIVAIDFGTTNSGFAFVHKENQNDPNAIDINKIWPGDESGLNAKTPTVLQYDSKYKNVTAWGARALDQDKPWLPPQLNYKQAIKDYLTEMRKLIEKRLTTWNNMVKFPDQVRIVLTIPAEWPPHTTGVMRECAYKAGLLSKLSSNNLEFTTEPEAAALHCLNVVKTHNLKSGDSFCVVDCGGGTVDITIRKLLEKDVLGEITERIGYPCGSTFVDKEFLKFIGGKVGLHAFSELKTNHYNQIQYLLQEFFFRRIKRKFNGKQSEWKTIKLNLLKYCSKLQDYVTGDRKTEMENAGWTVKIDFPSVKEMFDPVVNKILEMISDQLKASKEKCSAIFLVGGFSESSYLVEKVKENFRFQVDSIGVPTSAISAVVQGGLYYGLNVNTVKTRVLKWTFGIEVAREWVSGKDKKTRRSSDGLIYTFECLAKRGSKVDVNEPFTKIFYPVRANQEVLAFKIYCTKSADGKFCDDQGMKYVKTLKINIKDVHNGRNRPIEFSLTFGQLECKAAAKNNRTGHLYKEISFVMEE